MTRIFCFRCSVAGLTFALGTMVLVCGCSSGPKIGGEVSGKVEFAGKPVQRGGMKVQCGEGRPVLTTIMDGSYKYDKLPVGTYKVAISSTPPEPPTDKIMMDGQPDPKWLREQAYVPVPTRYGDIKTTPLILEVTTESQTKDFKLDP